MPINHRLLELNSLKIMVELFTRLGAKRAAHRCFIEMLSVARHLSEDK